MPEISVIVPVYKVENYIHRCVDSILAQTFTDFELILVDDGSPDNCGRICDEYAQKDSRVHVIHKENSGVSAARNRGISESAGVYITFVDSDDYIDLDYLLNLYNNRSNLTICGLVAENPSGDIVYRNVYSSIRYSNRGEIDFARLYRENAVYSVYCKLFTKEIIDLYGLRFPNGICWGEDGMFVADYLQCIESIRVTEYTGYHYMISQSNNSLATSICADSVERVALSREYCIDKMKETAPLFFDEVKYYCMSDIRQNCAYYIKLLLCDESLEIHEKVRILDCFFEKQYVREVIEDPVSYFPNDKVMHISVRQKSSEGILRKYKRLSKWKKSIDAFNAWIKRSVPSKVKRIYRMRKKSDK